MGAPAQHAASDESIAGFLIPRWRSALIVYLPMRTARMRSNRVQTRDLRMHYLQAGTGEPLLFLHGFPETSFEWRHQLEHFSSRYACFAPDTRGYGGTDKPGIRCTRQLLAQD